MYGPDNFNDQDTMTAVSIWINDKYFIYPVLVMPALVKRDLDPDADQLVRNEEKKLLSFPSLKKGEKICR